MTLSREYEVGADLSVGTRLLRGSGELLRVPSIDIAEVGAGGGSIAWVDSAGGLQVGPRSAGAVPGPACYGLGGDDPTVTDANVVLGYVRSGPLAGDAVSISPGLAQRAVESVATPLGLPVQEAARGVHDLANARMMRALRAVSSERGRDPREFALIAFGGAGPIHAASLATELGIDTVVVPPNAGVFSAAGLLYARPEYHDVRFCELDARDPSVATTMSGLFDELELQLESSISGGVTEWVRSADVRYKGQSFDIEVTIPGTGMDTAALADLIGNFEDRHEQLYGVRKDPDDPIQVRAVRLAALGPLPRTERVTEGEALVGHSHEAGQADGTRPALFALADGYLDAPVLNRRDEVGRDGMAGPLLIDEYDTTIVIPPGWIARWHSSGALYLAPPRGRGGRRGTHRCRDPPDRGQRPGLGGGRDGHHHLPDRPLDRRAGRDGLLGRPTRTRRPDRGPGGHHPLPPRSGPHRGRCPTGPLPRQDAARGCLHNERPVRRRDAPARRVRHQAGLLRGHSDRLRSCHRPPRRHRRSATRQLGDRQHRGVPGRSPHPVDAPLQGRVAPWRRSTR